MPGATTGCVSANNAIPANRACRTGAGRHGQPGKRLNMDDLTKLVRDYVVREYIEEGDDREVTETTPLISGGIVDSFSMVSLKRFLERKCHIQIPDADATPVAFDTVQSIVALVRRFQKT
jgi:acyl carrier protein